MTAEDAHHVKAFIALTLKQPLSAVGIDAASIPDDMDLRARGVIDSLGFLQLIANLEARFGLAIDFADMAPEQLTNVGALCRHVASQLVSAHHAP